MKFWLIPLCVALLMIPLFACMSLGNRPPPQARCNAKPFLWGTFKSDGSVQTGISALIVPGDTFGIGWRSESATAAVLRRDGQQIATDLSGFMRFSDINEDTDFELQVTGRNAQGQPCTDKSIYVVHVVKPGAKRIMLLAPPTNPSRAYLWTGNSSLELVSDRVKVTDVQLDAVDNCQTSAWNCAKTDVNGRRQAFDVNGNVATRVNFPLAGAYEAAPNLPAGTSVDPNPRCNVKLHLFLSQ